MTKGAQLAFTTAAALLVSLAIVACLGGREPTYKGLTMGQWLHSRDAQAEEGLLTLGTNNLSLLVKRIDYDPQKDLRARFFSLIYKVSRSPWVRDLVSHRIILAEEAHAVLYRLGANAAPAIPQLAEIAERRTGPPRIRALYILASMRDGCLGVVASHASTNDAASIRLSAVTLLGQQTESRLAFVALRNALEDSDARVRQAASEAISNHLQWNPHLSPAERSQLRERIHNAPPFLPYALAAPVPAVGR